MYSCRPFRIEAQVPWLDVEGRGETFQALCLQFRPPGYYHYIYQCFPCFLDSCNSLGCQYNGLPWNPTPPAGLTVGADLFVQCLNCEYSQPPPPT